MAGMRRVEGAAEQADLHAFFDMRHAKVAGSDRVEVHSAGHSPSSQSRLPWVMRKISILCLDIS
jgi:hypothetical protein